MSLLVTGTIGIDTIFTPAGEHRECILGGSGIYFAAAASLYGPVRLVAAVGDDYPADHRATIERFTNIDIAGLETRAGSKTFRWGGRYLDNMDQRESVFTDLNILGEAPPPVPDEFKDSSFVFLANMHPALQGDLLSQIDSPELVVADTMDLWINVAKDDLTTLLGRLDGLVLNSDEAEQFTGCTNTVTAGRHLLEHGPRFVVIKKGEHGAVLIHRDGLSAIPAYPTELVVDPTGAGDTFAGGMMGFMAAQRADGKLDDPGSFDSVRRALAHGTVIASFTIETFSLERLESLTQDQITARFDEFAAMLHFGQS